MSLHTWPRQGPCNPSSCATFTFNSHCGRAATGKKAFVHARRVDLVTSTPLRPGSLWPARLLCQGGVSRQEYWSILANTGFHTLLELYDPCCPSRRLP